MKRHHCLGVAVLAILNSTVVAQTGPALMLRPWSDDDQWQLHTDVMVENRGHTDNADARFRVERYDVSGRWRPEKDAAPGPLRALGFSSTYLNLSTADPVLPDRLVSQAIAAGFQLNEDGSLQLVAGFGYAGNNPYGDDDALYGQAGLIYTQVIDRQSLFRFVVSYDGNRAFLPDVPLPSVLYQRQVSETLSYAVGFPINTLHWQVNERLGVHVTYVLPVSLNLAVRYQLSDGWTAFGRFGDQLDAFKIDGGRDNRRLFFRQRRIEAGLKLETDQQVNLTLAAGYAFGQEFSTGFDVRDLDDIAEPSDEPYFRVSVELRF